MPVDGDRAEAARPESALVSSGVVRKLDAGRFRAALDSGRLVNAIERLPNVAIFHYNLACYFCQLGELERAKASLQQAIKLEPQYRAMALDDEDLKPLWKAI